ncbi:MAG: alpha/beta hydrolase [Polyangiaceae bacterium]
MSTPPSPSDPPLRRVELSGGTVSYCDEGAGPCVVAVHGLPGSSRDFRWLAPVLARGVRVIRPDMPGFGGTALAVEPDPSVDARARFVLEFLDALEVSRPVLLGHSMGGVVAARAVSMRSDRFTGLGLVSSPALRPHRLWLRLMRARRLLPYLANPTIAKLAGKALRPAFVKSGFRGSFSDMALSHTLRCLAAVDFASHAAAAKAPAPPCLVAFCDDDPMIEKELLIELAEACAPGPRLRFATGGHNPQKAWAEELGAAVVDWAAQLGRA